MHIQADMNLYIASGIYKEGIYLMLWNTFPAYFTY